MPLRVTNIQRGCVYDGPGIRTTVFLKGCVMHCPWCCNPETISRENEYFIDDSKCLSKSVTSNKLCEPCERRGGPISIYKCPFGVTEHVSKDYSVDELYVQLSKDFSLMKSSGGGVTFSGGEPLLQINDLEMLLVKLKNQGINIYFETTLATSAENVKRAIEYSDGLIVDIKLQPEHHVSGDCNYIPQLKDRIEECKNRGVRVTFRMVFLDSMVAEQDKVISCLKDNNIDDIELIRCHNLGKSKYIKLNASYSDYSATESLFYHFADTLVNNNIATRVLSV